MSFHRLVAACLFACCISTATAQSTQESALYEKLLDIKALVGAGVSFNDYQKQMPELIILRDRFERTGGANLGLSLSTQHYLAAIDLWQKHLSDRTRTSEYANVQVMLVKLSQISLENLQREWGVAETQLTSYTEEMVAKAHGQTKKPLAKKKTAAASGH